MDKKTEEMIGAGVGILVLLIIGIALWYYMYAHKSCASAKTDCTNTSYPLCGLAGTTPPTSTAKGRCMAGTPSTTAGGTATCPTGFACTA